MVQLGRALAKTRSKNAARVLLSYMPLPAKNIISRQNTDGDINLLSNLDPSVVFKITGVAATIWPLLDGEISVGEIFEKLKADFPDTDNEVIFSLLKNFIHELRTSSLIE